MVAPVLQSSSSASSGSAGTSGSASKPTGVAVGDLLIAIVTARSDVTSITPAIAWDVVESNLTGSGSTYAVFKRIADGTEGSSLSFTFSGTTRWCIGILRIDGHDPTTPINVSAEDIVASGGVYDTPSVTTTVDDCLVIRSAHHMRGNASFNAWASGTELWDISGGSLTQGCIQTVAYMTAASAGATGTVQVTATSGDVTGAGVTVAIAPTPPAAVSKDLTVKWAIDLEKDLTVKWSILSDGIQKSLTIVWDVAQPISKDLSLLWTIRLYKDLNLKWKLLNPEASFFDYQVIVPTAHSPLVSNWDKTPSLVPDVLPALSTGLVIPDHTPLPAIGSSEYLYFYGDYYLRIWLDPSVVRLNNPRIDTEISFNLWNAFPNTNELIEAIDTDLPGVQLEFSIPVSFLRYEYKTLGFSITSGAPAKIDGSYEFIFSDGEALLRIIATIIEVANILPAEPIVETWVWKTNILTSHNASEKRYALRQEPRYRLNYTVTLPDEGDRRKRYTQLWSFLSRDLRMPLFQYAVDLDQEALTGETKLYLNPAIGDFRDDEFMALINVETQSFKVVKVSTVDLDGVTLETALDEDISFAWLAVPTIAMRIPDGSGLSMDAKTGEATINAESVQYRTLIRPDSAATVTTFDGFPVLDLRPIAVDSLEEAFEQGTEIVDNDMALPEIHSFWPTPFVSGSRQWKIDRDSDMDFWRKFCHDLIGMQNPFLMPTWRSDLELFEAPSLSSNVIRITGTEYVDQWENETYKRIQVETRNEIIHRKVSSYEDPGDGTLILTLNSPIGSAEGDDEIQRISFLNIARLDSDMVTLEHLTNWTIVTLQVRTINE